MVDPLKVLWVLTNSTFLVSKFIHSSDNVDGVPFFEQPHYEVDVEENVKLHTSIIKVVASTKAPGSDIRYEILNTNRPLPFTINSHSGVITTSGSIDYEKNDKYELVVVAKHESHEANAVVNVKVMDMNDNPPVFERPTYRTQIMEEDDRNLPKRILQVTATDADKNRLTGIVYFVTGPGVNPENPEHNAFSINSSTGEIFVLKALDRDPPHGRAQWRFTVFAQDEGGEGLVGYADVQLSLKDVNDNAPQFMRSLYWGNVTENNKKGTIVMIMKAIDYDDINEGFNAQLSYSIEKNVIDEDSGAAIFDIESKTGVIRTAICCLDRERTPDYSIQVTAMDGGGLKGTGTATIKVLDINDMPPTFTKSEWLAEINETEDNNVPDTPIITVTVNDADEINTFHYKIVENSGFGANKFMITTNSDNTGSIKILKPLDYDDVLQRNGFKFRIQVSDKGADVNDEYHKAYAHIVIHLKDLNDNYPVFDQDNKQVLILENVEAGTVLCQFKANDVDNGGKSQITYHIERNSDPKRQFNISQTGVVTVQRKLDREETELHKIKILAIDDGIPQRTSIASLFVVVEDVNDNAPDLSHEYRPIIQENISPTKIVEVHAKDKDDTLKKNSAPYTFEMDPTVDDVIKTSFIVEYNPNGDGSAIISSLRSFDREFQKEYHIPIVITDSGQPPISGTSTVTVVIGDINDNDMKDGSKEIIVYCQLSYTSDIAIGSVYVNDLDDWDLPDKKFFWDGMEHPSFRLNDSTGMITMRHGTEPNRYHLRFQVHDQLYQSYVLANVTVTVKNISLEAIMNSGSIRINDITDEEFISVWDYKAQTIIKSKASIISELLANYLKIPIDNIDIFSIKQHNMNPPVIDVYVSVHKSSYISSTRLNGIIMMNREQIQREASINITMVGIDECLYENINCKGSCTNRMEVEQKPVMVNSNRTALVGIHIKVIGDCFCGVHNFSGVVNCKIGACLNGGNCVQEKSDIRCLCKKQHIGPRCEQTTRSFQGTGWAWFPALPVCERSHLSLEFVTKYKDGLLLYNGPIVPPMTHEVLLSDFISMELIGGMPRILIDFGSGTTELSVRTVKTLDDGEWHRLDVIWDTKEIQLIIDFCKFANMTEEEDGKILPFNNSGCHVKSLIHPFNEYLNVNTPLQLGGLNIHPIDPSAYHWDFVPIGKSFNGCIKNVFYNGQMYDLAEPALLKNSEAGCPGGEILCKTIESINSCEKHGFCVSNLNEAWCECKPGWTGLNCLTQTVPATFSIKSYVKYALSFEPNHFTTLLQLRFKTRELQGELFRVSDQHFKKYAILEITDRHLQFCFNLNSIFTEEKCIMLYYVEVNDGRWHTVKVSRYGSIATLEIDGGGGRKYNETFELKGHQLLLVDKQEGIYAGGKAEYINARTYEVYSDFQKGCMDDIVLEGKNLPLPPMMNGTQWGQATMARNVQQNCVSNKSCENATCTEPFECKDMWNEIRCICTDGWIYDPVQNICIDINECLEQPCNNGGTCINKEPQEKYQCLCRKHYWGKNCEFIAKTHKLMFSFGAIISVVGSSIIVLSLIMVLISRIQQKSTSVKPSNQPDDVIETMITFKDVGDGAEDMTIFDPKSLQINASQQHTTANIETFAVSWIHQIEEQKVKMDEYNTSDCEDSFQNYSFEGGGSEVESLSSLCSGLDINLTDILIRRHQKFPPSLHTCNNKTIEVTEVNNEDTNSVESSTLVTKF